MRENFVQTLKKDSFDAVPHWHTHHIQLYKDQSIFLKTKNGCYFRFRAKSRNYKHKDVLIILNIGLLPVK